MLEFEIPKKSNNKQKQREVIIKNLNKDFNINISFGNSFSIKKKQVFFTDLSVLLSSGITLVSSLELVSHSFKNEKDVALIKSFIDDLTEGLSFYEVLKKNKSFTPYEYYSIKIGEETGKLKDILNELAKYITGRIEQKRKIVSAFSYPVVILLTAIIAVGFMLNFIVPMFDDIFKRFDKELPYLTKLVIKVSDNSSTYLMISFSIIATIFLINHFLKNNYRYKYLKSSLILKIPVFGILIKKITLARFCLTMELLLSAKTPLVDSLKLSANMIGLFIYQDALMKIEKAIYNGQSLFEGMSGYKIFDLRMLALIKVGEEVNKLEDIFSQLKKQFNNDIEYQTSMISGIMEPFLIIFIGLFVGLILVSMYLPIFKISTSFM